VNKYGSEIQLFGCVTNRLNLNDQLYNNEFSEVDSILYHKKIADKLYSEKYLDIRLVNKIAGFFMLFNKETWKENNFKENTLLFDTLFCKRLLKNDRKIGLIEGLYLFHFYRF